MQLYQSGVSLEPNTRYRLSFAGKSTLGHDVRVRLFKQVSPYPLYGLDYTANLGTDWVVFTTEFNTTGFTTSVTDGRLQFYFVPFAKAGDIYYIDDVRLEKVSAPSGSPGFTTHPSDRTVIEGQTATFSVAATGGSLSYQWQKNGVNISGATIATYITPSATLADNGAIFRVIVSNAAGSVVSNNATLTVLPAASINLIKNPGFESGKTSWAFYTNAAGPTFNAVPPGYEGNYSAKLAFSKTGTNMQLYQSGIPLEPNTRYRLSFAGKSTFGHDVIVRLFKQVSPYTLYGLDYTADLGTDWAVFTTEFNTTGFTTNVTNGRFYFFFAPFAKAGDTYNIDNVILEKVTAEPSAPPAVIGNAPNGTNVPVTAVISVNFSKPMDQASVQSALSTTPATTGGFSWSGNNMIYTPANLNYSTTYNVIVGTAAMDSAGNQLLSAYNWSFTTAPDTANPEVSGNTPTGNSEPVTTKITLTFSEAMNTSSAQSAFSTFPGTTGSFSWSGKIMTYTPDSNLTYNTTYNVIVGTGAMDLAGNNLSVPYEWNFTTMEQDMTNPTVIDYSPKGTNVSLASMISVNFTEAMDQESVQSSFSAIPATKGSFSWNGNTVKYIPDSNLTSGTTYSVTIGSDAKDLAGNNMPAHTWQFTTALSPVVNLIQNPGFESGKTSWAFYTNAAGPTFNAVPPGYEGNYSAKLAFSTVGTNMQLYQSGIPLEPNTRYRLSFTAYSTTGHDIRVRLFKQVSPYPLYGLDYTANIGMNWQDFTTEFTTKGFTSHVNDGRLQFWLVPFAAAGDTYFIDDVRLEEVIYNEKTPPNITIWYGNKQRFGHMGMPQKWVNILGNVQDVSGIASMNYSLNNGSALPLSTGPDTYRLQSMGDFNVEINRSDLRCGDNRLVIRAADNAGNSNNETVSVNYSCNDVLPENYNINWSDVTEIQDAAQILDGLWVKEANSIRPAVVGYDRLIGIGNMTWDDYEITAPITINTPLDTSARSGGPNFGFGLRWQGHSDWNNQYPAAWKGIQPRVAWYPLGALGVYIWNQTSRDFQLTLIGNNMTVINYDKSGKHLLTGITYIFKMKAQAAGSRTLYSLKVWDQNISEPSTWTISGYGVSGELKHGSITLNSHYANISFGNISIRQGPFAIVTTADVITT